MPVETPVRFLFLRCLIPGEIPYSSGYSSIMAISSGIIGLGGSSSAAPRYSEMYWGMAFWWSCDFLAYYGWALCPKYAVDGGKGDGSSKLIGAMTPFCGGSIRICPISSDL